MLPVPGKIFALILALLAVLPAAGCSRQEPPEPTPDPHAGMVQVQDGAGGMMWVKLYEDAPVSPFGAEMFYAEDGFVRCSTEDYTVRTGIDVSFYQGEIDWAAVAADGVEFAIIRCGYRGSSEGGLYEDERFRQNMDGALAAGLEVGLYFFSQAISVSEAVQEAEYVISLAEGYDVSLPVVFDWEEIGNGQTARTDGLDGTTLTDCGIAFCDTVRAAGYKPCIYFYPRLGYSGYELDRLENIAVWLSQPGEVPYFYYAYDMWQYSHSGSVDGIDGGVDMNLLFVKN